MPPGEGDTGGRGERPEGRRTGDGELGSGAFSFVGICCCCCCSEGG